LTRRAASAISATNVFATMAMAFVPDAVLTGEERALITHRNAEWCLGFS